MQQSSWASQLKKNVTKYVGYPSIVTVRESMILLISELFGGF